MVGVAVLVTMAEPCPAQQNVVAPDGVAVGGNVVNSSITFGLKPEEVQTVTEPVLRISPELRTIAV